MDAMTFCCLALNPSNVVSVIKTGTQPDEFEDKEIRIYESFQDALQSCPEFQKLKAGINQTFLFELRIPKTENSPLIQKIQGVFRNHYLCTNFNSSWIQCAWVASETGKKLLSRLLNSDHKFEIIIDKQHFGLENLPISASAPRVLLEPIAHPKFQVIEKQGDLLGSRMQALVNTVNCVGVMGKGIALAFKKKYPSMYEDYRKRCLMHQVFTGQPYIYSINPQRKVINFPTKKHWKNPSELKWVEEGLIYLRSHLKEWGITSIALPPLGCGNGQLQWEKVKPLIYKYLEGVIPIEIYVPFGPKPEKNAVQTSTSMGKRQRYLSIPATDLNKQEASDSDKQKKYKVSQIIEM